MAGVSTTGWPRSLSVRFWTNTGGRQFTAFVAGFGPENALEGVAFDHGYTRRIAVRRASTADIDGASEPTDSYHVLDRSFGVGWFGVTRRIPFR